MMPITDGPLPLSDSQRGEQIAQTASRGIAQLTQALDVLSIALGNVADEWRKCRLELINQRLKGR